jgi:hypothetical protein
MSNHKLPPSSNPTGGGSCPPYSNYIGTTPQLCFFSYYGCYSFKHRWDVACLHRMCQCWRTNGWMIDPSSPSWKFKCLMVKAPLWCFFFFCKDTMMLSFGFAGEYNEVIFWIHRWIRGGLILFVIFEVTVVSHKALVRIGSLRSFIMPMI